MYVVLIECTSNPGQEKHAKPVSNCVFPLTSKAMPVMTWIVVCLLSPV